MAGAHSLYSKSIPMLLLEKVNFQNLDQRKIFLLSSNMHRNNCEYIQSLQNCVSVANNVGHNILELYNVSVLVQLTTSKTKLDIQYINLCIGVASRFTQRRRVRILQEIRKYKKISKLGGDSLVPSLPSKNKSLAIAVKFTQKQISMKVF